MMHPTSNIEALAKKVTLTPNTIESLHPV